MIPTNPNNYTSITCKPYAPNLGAEIYGVDLSRPVSDSQFNEIHQAFLQYQVLFFKEQKEIPPEQPNTIRTLQPLRKTLLTVLRIAF